MVSLISYRVCLPAEDLQTSQRRHPFVHRAKKGNTLSWHTGTWNVPSMVDTVGPVDVASQREDGQRGEYRKVDLTVSKMM